MTRLRRSLAWRLLSAYQDSQASNYAAALAFNAFMTMFPIILGLFAILGLFLRDTDLYRAVEHLFVGLFTVNARDSRDIDVLLAGATRHAETLGIVSVLALAWSGTGLHGSLEFALNHVYGVAGRSFLRQRLGGLRLIGVFAVAVVAAVSLNSLTGLIDPNLTPLNILGGWLVLTYLLFWIYRFVPNLKLSSREVLPGALAAGALMELVSLVFPVFYHLAHAASVYTKGFALFFLIASWLYVLSLLLLMGAVLNTLLQPPRPTSAGDVPGLEQAAAFAISQNAKSGGVEAQLGAGGHLPAEKGAGDRPQDVAVGEGDDRPG